MCMLQVAAEFVLSSLPFSAAPSTPVRARGSFHLAVFNAFLIKSPLSWLVQLTHLLGYSESCYLPKQAPGSRDILPG